MQQKNEKKIEYRITKLYLNTMNKAQPKQKKYAKPVSSLRLDPDIEELIQEEIQRTGKSRTQIISESIIAGMRHKSARAFASKLLLAQDFLRRLRAEMDDEAASNKPLNSNH